MFYCSFPSHSPFILCATHLAGAGGVLAVAAALDGSAWLRNPTVVKAALGALRQLSSSDAVKTLLAERGGVDKVRQVSIGAFSVVVN